MAAISLTAADIRPLHPAAVTRRFNAGGTVTVGQAVYIASDGDVEASDADAEGSSLAIGICVAVGSNGATSAAAGDRVDVCVFGPVTGFSGMTPGAPVFVSTTAGALDQTAASASGDFINAIGYAESATTIFVQPFIGDLTAIS